MIIDQTMAKPAIAYALGRRVGGAVERNLLRRRLREIFKTKPVLPGFYLVGAYSGAKKLTFIELGENVESLLEKCAQKPIKTNKSVENSRKMVEIPKKIEKSSELRSCE